MKNLPKYKINEMKSLQLFIKKPRSTGMSEYVSYKFIEDIRNQIFKEAK